MATNSDLTAIAACIVISSIAFMFLMWLQFKAGMRHQSELTYDCQSFTVTKNVTTGQISFRAYEGETLRATWNLHPTVARQIADAVIELTPAKTGIAFSTTEPSKN